ncbi:SH3 domain-containing protein [Metabacillus litoralis]|uniref:SH3 domain-containing protein n=1 Tax=Metabacillus litoralis TaxID=152268 RepID=UPI0020400265|nr:SH3 domain-containing protein [Metabacillus litoralis]MCM3650581.1 SH3 domain-containing protein [Metabacillus litoralis]
MIRKGLTIFICFALFFAASFVCAIPTSNAANKQIIINVDVLNVRSGAALSSAVIAKVKKGQAYDVVEKKNDWIKIKLSSNSTGWVAEWLVTQRKGANHTSTTQSITSDGGTVESAASGLRFRSGPGTSFAVVGVFEKGKKATYLTKSGDWIKISYLGKQGWVSASYVKGNTSNSNSQQSEVVTNKASVTATSLNVRKTPTTSGARVGSLKKNTIVAVNQVQGDWVQIETTGLKGWVHNDYLTFTTSNHSTGNSRVANASGTVTATTLSIRDSGSLNGKIIGSISKGTKVSIVEEKNDWYKISNHSNKTGWVAGWYISKSDTKNATAQSSNNNKQVNILYDGTNIRSGSSTSHSILKRANVGETYEIIDTIGDWYKIKLKGKQIGYIAGWVAGTSGVSSPVTKSGSAQYVKNKTIVIDPGHGGQDSGAVGSRGTLEKKLTLATSKLLYNKLKSAGANVYLTRSNDSYVSLSSRVATSNYRNAQAFISLHFDSMSDRSASGTTIYYFNSQKDARLAAKLNSEVVKQTKLRDRGTRYGNFHVLRENHAPAALLELGFLSNRAEELTVQTTSYQERAAQGIFNGLAQYFK